MANKAIMLCVWRLLASDVCPRGQNSAIHWFSAGVLRNIATCVLNQSLGHLFGQKSVCFCFVLEWPKDQISKKTLRNHLYLNQIKSSSWLLRSYKTWYGFIRWNHEVRADAAGCIAGLKKGTSDCQVFCLDFSTVVLNRPGLIFFRMVNLISSSTPFIRVT